MRRGFAAAVLGAALALSASADAVAWLWDDSARTAETVSTVTKTVPLLVAKGGGRGLSAAYGSGQEPFESRFTSTGRVSGFALSSKPPAAMAIIFR